MSEFDLLRQQALRYYVQWLAIGALICIAGGALSTMVGSKKPWDVPQKIFIRIFLAGPLYVCAWLPIVGIYTLGAAAIKAAIEARRERHHRERHAAPHRHHRDAHPHHPDPDGIDDEDVHTEPDMHIDDDDAPHA